jgi:DNA-binding transcriptional MocR family regulator
LRVTPIKKVNVSDRIVEQILALITRGELRPGSRLPAEKELMAMFGVGRSSIREKRCVAFPSPELSKQRQSGERLYDRRSAAKSAVTSPRL